MSLKNKTFNDEKLNLSQANDIILQSLLINATTEKIVGNLDTADSLFKVCLKIDPYNAVSYFELSDVYKQLDKKNTALEYAKKAVKLSPENEWYKADLAILHLDLKNYKDASILYEELSEKYPKKHDYLFSKGECYVFINELNKAIITFNDLEELIGLNEELTIYKHQLYLKLGDVKKAKNEIQKLIDNYPNEIRYYGILAELYETIGEPDKAIILYEKILSLDPKNGHVHLSMFKHHLFAGDKERSLVELKKAFQATDVVLGIKTEILISFLHEFQTNPQIKPYIYELCEILTVVHPENAKSYSIYGEFLLQDEKIDSALHKFKKATEFDVSKFSLWDKIIILESNLLMFNELAIDSKQAIDYFPSQPSFYLFNGIANIQIKDYEKAIDALTIGKELVIGDNYLLSDFYQYLGDAYHEINDHINSDIAYEESLINNPNNPYVLNNFSYYLAKRKINLDNAEKMILKALELIPNNANYLDTYGWILLQKGKLEDAEIWIQRSLSNGGIKNGVILEHYGDVLFLLNRKSEAIEYWQKAELTGNFSANLKQKISEKQYME